MNEDIRICFVGDSFVNGTGDETGLGWAGRLCARAMAKGVAVTCYNLGVRRDTSRDVLSRWESECAPRLPDFCDGRIVVSFGVNDTKIEDGSLRVQPEESCRNVREILMSARAKHTVIMVGPPPTHDGEQNKRIEAISTAFWTETTRLDVPYIETFSHLISDHRYRAEIGGNDGAHPRSYGYEKLSEIILDSGSWWF